MSTKQPAVAMVSSSDRRSPLLLFVRCWQEVFHWALHSENLLFHRAFHFMNLSNMSFFCKQSNLFECYQMKEEMGDHPALLSNAVA